MLRRAGPDDAAMIAAWLNRSDNRGYLAENLRQGQLSEQIVKLAIRRKDQAWFVYFERSFRNRSTRRADSAGPR